MKCTNKSNPAANARRRRNRLAVFLSILLFLLCICAAGIYYYQEIDSKARYLSTEYMADNYRKGLHRGKMYTEDLCVASENVSLEDVPSMTGVRSAALFDLDQKEVDFAYNIHERVYPASTTKILTALLACKNGNLSDTVTVSANADAARFAADEATCGLKEGDQLTLEDLLYGLLLHSGNDNAVAIAEHISGSNEAFVELMNEQAARLYATNSHFVNANGLHNADHYTTAYDLYLIFNECIKYPEFLEIIQAKSYTAKIKGADGTIREITWEPTNHYATGESIPPDNATIVGGKTGTTKSAGNCLILLEKTEDDRSFISVIMGAGSKLLLYQDMTQMIQAIEDN